MSASASALDDKLGPLVEATNVTIQQLQARARQINADLEALDTAVTAAAGIPTAEQMEQAEKLKAELDSNLSAQRFRNLRTEASESTARSNGRQTEPDQPVNNASERLNTPVRTRDRVLDDPKLGYRSFGAFAQDVAQVQGLQRQAMDIPRDLRERLAPTTYGNETAGSDGGYAVPPDFRTTIRETIESEDSLLRMCNVTQTNSNSVKQPVDFNPDWDNTNGIRVFWGGEAAAMTQSKPKLDFYENPVHKQYALVLATEEVLADAAQLESHLMQKAPRKMMFNMNLKIVQGTGAGEPLGIINSPCCISVTKETSQVADTLVAANIQKMWARCYGPARRTAVWLINQDIEPKLYRLSQQGLDDTGAVTTGYGAFLYVPPGGLSASPYGSLMGRPVIPTQACETLGDKGDIILASLGSYDIVEKVGGLRQDMSIHLFFDYDVSTFKFVFRVGGMPAWRSTLAARDGSTTYSPFVTLAERA